MSAARESAMVHSTTQKFDIRKLVLSCLLAATAVLSGCGGSSESQFEQIVRQSNCVTADQVYSDYQNNEVAAQQKYQGRVNRICGIVDEIELNLFNEPLISLDAPRWGTVSIGGIDTASAANISKGSVAVFECNKINELLGIPVLMECRIVPIQNMPNEAASASEQTVPNEPSSDAVALATVNENDQSVGSSLQDGTCKLQISGKVMFDGECKYILEVGGSFTIYENYGLPGYFAMLQRDGNSANGYWNGARDSDHAQDELGLMTRRGACWADEIGSSQICVWGS